MHILRTKKEVANYVSSERLKNKVIGFVPTMGALHNGHMSLVKVSNTYCDITIVSIFVNPTQFNDSKDLKNYPRTVEVDLELLENNCNAVFVPEAAEIYPEKDIRIFDFDGIDSLMEGEHRPGHFNGVAQVVSRLFQIVNPDKAVFGQKDFQQVAIIRKMVQKLKFDIEIIVAPIVRESDGLAMSSRNRLLEPKYREIAGLINKVLTKSVKKTDEMSVLDLKSWVVESINNSKLLEVEYFEIVNENSLLPVVEFDKNNVSVGCIAVWAGNVRLIDNVMYDFC